MIKKVTETVHNMFVRHHLTCFIVIATPLLVAVVADAQTLRNEAARICQTGYLGFIFKV